MWPTVYIAVIVLTINLMINCRTLLCCVSSIAAANQSDRPYANALRSHSRGLQKPRSILRLLRRFFIVFYRKYVASTWPTLITSSNLEPNGEWSTKTKCSLRFFVVYKIMLHVATIVFLWADDQISCCWCTGSRYFWKSFAYGAIVHLSQN